jgi:hypothetical protein
VAESLKDYVTHAVPVPGSSGLGDLHKVEASVPMLSPYRDAFPVMLSVGDGAVYLSRKQALALQEQIRALVGLEFKL